MKLKAKSVKAYVTLLEQDRDTARMMGRVLRHKNTTLTVERNTLHHTLTQALEVLEGLAADEDINRANMRVEGLLIEIRRVLG